MALTALGLGSAALLLLSSAQAATVTFQEGTNNYTGTLDQQLEQADPTSNTTEAQAVLISADLDDPSGSGNDAQILLRFQNIIGNGAGQIPAGQSIISATLRLYTVDATDNTTAAELKVHRMLVTWDESSSWNSMNVGITNDGTEAVITPDITFNGSQDEAFDELNVTATVQEWVNSGGANNFGWAILAGVNNGWDMATSEATEVDRRPLLTVVYGVAEPPVITQQPIASTNVVECSPFTLSVTVTGTGPFTYQWAKAGIPITDATNRTYTVARAQLNDTEPNYTVTVTGLGGAVQSNPSAVTVTEDVAAPTVTSVLGEGNRTNIVVTFSEALKVLNQSEQDNLAFTYTLQNSLGLSPQIATNYLSANGRSLIIQLTEPRNLGEELLFGITGIEAIPLYEACKEEKYVAATNMPVLSEYPIFGYTKSWKYEASGTDQGTAWSATAFDDSAWQSGPGIFDAANSPRATIGNFTVGTSLARTNSAFPANAIPTYYFRTHFNYPDNASGIIITPAVDDGAIIYLNGVEVARVGIPAGVDAPFASYSEALGQSGSVGTVAPGTPIIVNSGLVVGDNVIAVEVKQFNSTSSDMDFGLQVGAIASTALPCVVTIERQPAPATVVEGGSTTLSVSATGQDLQYQWFRGGSALAGATSASLQLTNVSRANNEGDYTVTVTPGCDPSAAVTSTAAHVTVTPDTTPIRVLGATLDSSTNQITVSFAKTNGAAFTLGTVGNYSLSPDVTIQSATIVNGTNVVLQTAPLGQVAYTLTISGVRDNAENGNFIIPNPSTYSFPAQVRLVNFNQAWKYDQSGSDLGTDWRAPGFNDAAWQSGAGFLALEPDAPIVATMTALAPPSGINTPLSLTNAAGTRIITYYFRTTFDNTVTDLSTVSLNLRAIVDDGAVFYLNGNQVHVFNISTNSPITAATVASGTTTEGAIITATNLTGLVVGQNTLAVEVHQNNTTSSDVVFGAELTVVITPSTGGAKLTTVVSGTGITLSWDKAGTLQESPTIANPTWSNCNNQANPQVITPAGTMKFYRVAQ